MQGLVAEGEANGIAKGEAKGKAEGKVEMRQAIVELVRERFPVLVELAREVVATMDTFPQLARLTAKIGSAQSLEQTRQVLSDTRQ